MAADRTLYTKTIWVNDVTKLNASNLNHIESGIEVNNLLSKENANYIDEIYRAFISQLSFTYDNLTHGIILKIGESDSESSFYTPTFHVEKNIAITGFYTTHEADILLNEKVDKVAGKQLSTNDFNNDFKNKLNEIQSGAQVNIIEGVQVDGVDLSPDANKKVNVQVGHLLPKSSAVDSVYATNFSGAQVMLPLDQNDTSGTIPTRASGGFIYVPLTPTLGNHAVSKQYTDTYAKSLVVSMDSSNYKLTFTLKDANNNPLTNTTIDLPLESVVVSGSYDNEHQKIVLTLQNGSTIDIPVDDLVEGLINSVDLSSTLSGYVAKSEVVDNLTSTDDDLPLSANQGKVLKQLVDSKVDTTTFNTSLASKEDIIVIGNGLKKDSSTNTLSSLITATDVVINLN